MERIKPATNTENERVRLQCPSTEICLYLRTPTVYGKIDRSTGKPPGIPDADAFLQHSSIHHLNYLMLSRQAILSIFLHLLFNVSAAQEEKLTFKLVEGNNRKPLGKINAIAQDTRGFMWFAGQGAGCIYMYDGVRMTSFVSDSSRPNALNVGTIETLIADKQGIIWIGGSLGLGKYDPATGLFTHFIHDENDSGSLSAKSVSSLYRDTKKRLWVGTDKGLNRLDEKTGKFIRYLHNPADSRSISDDFINTIYEDQEGTIWVGTGIPWFLFSPEKGGLNRLDDDGRFSRFLHEPGNKKSLINNKVRSVFEDSRGVFWVGTLKDGLHTLDRKTGKFTRHQYDPKHPESLSRPPVIGKGMNDPITFINEDVSGAIWIATREGGLNRYDPTTKKIVNYKHSNGFVDASGWASFSSVDGVFWIATEEGNLYRVDLIRKKFIQHSTVAVSNFLEEKNGKFWVGTDGFGLLKYDKTKKLIHHYKEYPGSLDSLGNGIIRMISQQNQDTIWVGTFNGLYSFNTLTESFSKFEFDSSKTQAHMHPISGILNVEPGSYWISRLIGPGEPGLLRYKLNSAELKPFIPATDTARSANKAIGTMFVDKKKNIWAGNWVGRGILRINYLTEEYTRISDGLAVNSIFADAKGDMWAGTPRGLYRLDTIQNKFIPFFDEQSDESKAAVGGIVEDQKNNLWLTTSQALIRINPQRDKIFTYGRKSGIDPNTLTNGLLVKSDGEVLVGNTFGFYSFHPEDLEVRSSPWEIRITEIMINNKIFVPEKGSLAEIPMGDINSLSLNHDQNNLSFNLAITDYRSPEDNSYFTRLDSYDTVWRESGAEKNVYYYQLDPGKYVLRIKAFDSDGFMLEKKVNIIIHSPWWTRWWAYVIYGLLLGSLLYAIYRMQKQRIVREERKKAEQFELAQAREIEKAYKELKATQAQLIQSEKMASLGELTAGIAHEIQNPLNFINNFAELNKELIDETNAAINLSDPAAARELLANLRENEEKIRHHGQRADSIVKNMLQHSRTSSGQKEPTDINALADEYFRLAYHGLRSKDKSFNVSLKTDFDPAVGKVNMVSQDIGRVLLNLYNNAFHAVHSRASAVAIAPQKKVVNEKNAHLTADQLAAPAEKHFEPIVRVSTKRAGKTLEIRIEDNGPGIPEKLKEKIFQPFFTTKPTGQGTGLGLSLSYDIVKAHGGELELGESAFGGACFVIHLPD